MTIAVHGDPGGRHRVVGERQEALLTRYASIRPDRDGDLWVVFFHATIVSGTLFHYFDEPCRTYKTLNGARSAARNWAEKGVAHA